MTPEQAGQLATRWAQGHPDQQRAHQLSALLRAELASLVPTDATCGVLAQSHRPVVAAVVDARLLLIEAAAGETGDPRAGAVSVRSASLDSRTATVSLASGLDPGGGAIRRRVWRFGLGEAIGELVVETRELLHGGFERDRGVPDDEQVCRAIARRLGWPLPEPDPGVAEY